MTTSKTDGTKAARLLRGKKTSKDVRSVAGSDLAQRPRKTTRKSSRKSSR